MAIDLNRFIATFFDEAHEHLEAIEERAMTLNSGKQDPEVLNAIFRAAHSIKGGSGTFGFTQLAEATHVMETLFDDYAETFAGHVVEVLDYRAHDILARFVETVAPGRTFASGPGCRTS